VQLLCALDDCRGRIRCSDSAPWTTAEAGYGEVTFADWATLVTGYSAVIVCRMDDYGGRIRCSDYLRTGRLRKQDTVQ
jgi:hypothetical protein